jgi:hypothetical protein
MMSKLIIFCLGFAALESTCSAELVHNSTSPEGHQKIAGHEAKPTLDEIGRHELRKKEKELKRAPKPTAPEKADINTTDIVLKAPEKLDANRTDLVPKAAEKPDANITHIVKPPIVARASDVESVNCAFANPTLEQAKELFGLGLFDTFKAAVEYAELTNAPFSAALGKWISKNITLEGLYDEGFAMGEIHQVWFNSTVPSEDRTAVICKMESALYSQMKNTCQYREWENDLILVSVSLMEGYAHAVDHVGFEGCMG